MRWTTLEARYLRAQKLRKVRRVRAILLGGLGADREDVWGSEPDRERPDAVPQSHGTPPRGGSAIMKGNTRKPIRSAPRAKGPEPKKKSVPAAAQTPQPRSPQTPVETLKQAPGLAPEMPTTQEAHDPSQMRGGKMRPPLG